MSTFGKHDPPYRGRFDSPLNLPKGHSPPPPMRFNGQEGAGPFGPYTAPAIPPRGDAQMPKPWLQGPSGRGQNRRGGRDTGLDTFGGPNPSGPAFAASDVVDRWGRGGALGPWDGPTFFPYDPGPTATPLVNPVPPGPERFTLEGDRPIASPICNSAVDFVDRNFASPPLDDPYTDFKLYVPSEGRAVRDKLIVFLPGVGGDPAQHNVIPQAYAQAGFRTIAMLWNGAEDPLNDAQTAAQTCLGWQPGWTLDTLFDAVMANVALNNCYYTEREQKMTDVTTNLLGLLQGAIAGPNGAEWARFLSPNGQIEWSEIVLAGYSEGANQVAYMIRQVPAFGAILTSGGFDLTPVEQPPNQTMATWLNDPILVTDTDRIVGLAHVGESWLYDFQQVMDENGAPNTTADAINDASPYRYNDANRLEYRSVVSQGTGEQQYFESHISTYTAESLFPAHQYLACKAGG